MEKNHNKKRRNKRNRPRKVICGYCGEQAKYTTTKEFFGRDYGYNLYVCHQCDARVGTHKGTTAPKGTLANERLRKMRQKCHILIDPYWRKGKYTRKEVYERLSKAMDIPKEKTHIGMFDEQQCSQLIGFFEKKAKKVAKQI